MFQDFSNFNILGEKKVNHLAISSYYVFGAAQE